MKASEILIRGKQNIVDLGWAQGDYIVTDEDPRNATAKVCGVCTLGACRLALLGIKEVTPRTDVFLDRVIEAEEYAAYQDAIDLLEVATGDYDVAGWNDKVHRTRDDVLNVFDAAIAAAKRNEE
ncbi:hypothetical protein SEA_SHAGRAT_64 [Rhodococcus phage Shagrat]|nr:hypothetical protein SEA_SHAGRAT_64 [Rhodococcus phage Shagrat]